ncbi:MAG: methyltransferase domain-containing protein [Anaerolineales bacterium]|nr:methyltransferase domain-containing protein [Anaerolineales bacterium]
MENRDLVKQRFGAYAQNYVDSTDHARSESLGRLLAVAQPRAGWRALDAATDGGHTALAVAPHVREVVVTELTAEMLSAAEGMIRTRGVANVGFGEADVTTLPFDAGAFDLVTCRATPLSREIMK